MKSFLLQDWKFICKDINAAWYPGYNDSDWLDIVVPHDWSVMYPFSKEYSSGTGYLPGGVGWYRTKFELDGNNETVFLHFDGVYKNAQVWINGHYLGRRPNGYIGFTYDVSAFVKRVNTVCVKVVHTDIADSRWFTGSGIYRKVTVQTHSGAYIPKNSIVFTYDGTCIHLSADVVGDIDCVNVKLGAHEWTVPVTDGKLSILEAIENPRLWSVDDPHLYTLSFGELCEPLCVGLRTFQFDANTGFSLNGVNMKIKGVCIHHDAGCLGAAVWPDVWRSRLMKLKAMGTNAIRGSHNPHMPEILDICDEIGLLFMNEAFDEWEGCKNKWVFGHNVYPPAYQGYFEDFPAWHADDLRDLVIRDRNHACVIAWSVGNEIDYPNDPYVHPLFTQMTGNNDLGKPVQEMAYDDDKPNAERLTVIAKELAAIVREYDKTRPVLFASAFPELSSLIGLFESFDIIGYNYKEHLYEQDHKRFPDLPIIGSENSHDEKNWEIVRNTPYIAAQFLWTGIDFLGEAKGWPVRGSVCGLIDIAGFEKPNYYKRAKMWGKNISDDTAIPPVGKIELVQRGIAERIGKYCYYQIEVRTGNDSDTLHYHVENGDLLGIENGNMSDLTAYSAPYRQVYCGRAIAYVRTKGNALLVVSGEGLPDESIALSETNSRPD